MWYSSSSAPCFLAANPGVCFYSKIWRFGINSRCSGVKPANPNFGRLIVYSGWLSGGCGQIVTGLWCSCNLKP